MVGKKKKPTKDQAARPKLHPKNKHQGRYDLDALKLAHPPLIDFVGPNVHGNDSIDFFDPQAVRALNTALLKHQYGIDYWDLPEGFLCPPIPGRADYIHHAADILRSVNFGQIPLGERVSCLDVGVGASCIYPIIGSQEYGWKFIGSDVDVDVLASAQQIIDKNEVLKGKVRLRKQMSSDDIFYNMIGPNDRFALSICNPPFHKSAGEAHEATTRKHANLTGETVNQPVLNFGGHSHELWCEGGELRFVNEMVRESKRFGDQVLWFTSMISKEKNVKGVVDSIKKAKAVDHKIVPMGQGQKSSRIIAWTFIDDQEKKTWQKEFNPPAIPS